jgi:protein involved in polysaccharide export with SLBB domain
MFRLLCIRILVLCFFMLCVSGCTQPRPSSGIGVVQESRSEVDALLAELRAERARKELTGNNPDTPVAATSPLPDDESLAAGVVTIQPDSVVQVTVREDNALDGSYQVNQLSAIELGYVGPVFLHNMTEDQASEKIKEVLENRFFNQATVSVRILRPSYDTVAIRGRVTRPGVLQIGAGDRISLNDALLRVGNVTASIRDAYVRVVRGGQTRAVAASEPGEEYGLVDDDGNPKVPDVWLWNNDVVFVFVRSAIESDSGAVVDVEQRETREVLVLGEVNRQGIYRFTDPSRATMMHLILQMGGFPAYADKDAIRVIRRDDEGNEKEFPVDATKILKEGNPDLDFALEDGDRVIVPARRMSLF